MGEFRGNGFGFRVSGFKLRAYVLGSLGGMVGERNPRCIRRMHVHRMVAYP